MLAGMFEIGGDEIGNEGEIHLFNASFDVACDTKELTPSVLMPDLPFRR